MTAIVLILMGFFFAGPVGGFVMCVLCLPFVVLGGSGPKRLFDKDDRERAERRLERLKAKSDEQWRKLREERERRKSKRRAKRQGLS